MAQMIETSLIPSFDHMKVEMEAELPGNLDEQKPYDLREK